MGKHTPRILLGGAVLIGVLLTAPIAHADVAADRRLRANGVDLVLPSGGRFTWKGVTGFQLLERVAQGDEAGAIAFLDWARRTGFNVVRVLSALCCWFDLTPQEGERALPRLIELARARGLYLHVVALAGTADRPFDYQAHVRALGRMAAQSDTIALIEIANEPYHGSQDPRLSENGFALLRELAALVPSNVLVTEGAAEQDLSREAPLGAVVTRHLARTTPVSDALAHLRGLADMARSLGRPVLSGEPIGAAEEDVAGRRSTDAAFFFEYGAECRKLNLACTFHPEDGLTAKVPGPKQNAAAKAFIRGMSGTSLFNSRGAPPPRARHAALARKPAHLRWSFLWPMANGLRPAR